MESTSWALKIYCMNCLTEDLDIVDDNITIEANLTSLFAEPQNPFVPSRLGRLRKATKSLAPIPKTIPLLNIIAIKIDRMPMQISESVTTSISSQAVQKLY